MLDVGVKRRPSANFTLSYSCVTVDDMPDIEKDFVHLARLALDGRLDDVAALTRRTLAHLVEKRPDLAREARPVLSKIQRKGPTRTVARPVPVDTDSRLELLRVESPVLPVEPVWPAAVQAELDAIIAERDQESILLDAGLAPTRTALFVGPPGVGKTFAAQWLSRQLGRQLLTLDLAAVMSSFLGRTGNNIRAVLEYARQDESVLLLDEFDAIAKRRDDSTEVGELKRLVTVLLQAVDDWPSGGVLVAATNHPELLDPAVWRRFERVVEFPLPTADEIRRSLEEQLRQLPGSQESSDMLTILAALLEGDSFALVERRMNASKRRALLERVSLSDCVGSLISSLVKEASQEQKIRAAATLLEQGLSQREVSAVTGLSRDTIRKYLGGKK